MSRATSDLHQTALHEGRTHDADDRSPVLGDREKLARCAAVLICGAVVLCIGSGCGSVRGTGKPLLQEGPEKSAVTASSQGPSKVEAQREAKDTSSK